MLVEEITHRVLNQYMRAIATLNMAAGRASDLECKEALQAAASELFAHAEAHRALRAPRLADTFDLSEYLEGICAALSSAQLNGAGVRLTLIQQPACLPAVKCWRLGLVVAELVNNAVRHGFQFGGGDIVVEVSTADGEICCSVTDNGQSSGNPIFGRGRTLVDCLTAEIGGRVEWGFAPGGVRVVIIIPALDGLEAVQIAAGPGG
jgi:two-component sensor histidine kinase